MLYVTIGHFNTINVIHELDFYRLWFGERRALSAERRTRMGICNQFIFVCTRGECL